MSQSDTIKALTALVEKQAVQITALLVRVESLEQELSFYKNRKNNGNSHIPSSVDLGKPKRNQSLREKSGKKAGGQQGHEGSTLALRAIPDEIMIYAPQYCHCCGDDLSAIPAIPLGKRQVIDIPQPVAICTEHRTFSKTCSCGHTTKGEFPAHVKAPCSVWQPYRSIDRLPERSPIYAIWPDTGVL